MGCTELFAHRGVATFDGCFNVFATKIKPTIARPNSGKNIYVYADIIYFYFGILSGWIGDLLDMEQPFVDSSTMDDHAKIGGNPFQ